MLFHQKRDASSPAPAHPCVPASFGEVEHGRLGGKIRSGNSRQAHAGRMLPKARIRRFPSAAVQQRSGGSSVKRFRRSQRSRADVKHFPIGLRCFWKFLRANAGAKQECNG